MYLHGTYLHSKLIGQCTHGWTHRLLCLNSILGLDLEYTLQKFLKIGALRQRSDSRPAEGQTRSKIYAYRRSGYNSQKFDRSAPKFDFVARPNISQIFDRTAPKFDFVARPKISQKFDRFLLWFLRLPANNTVTDTWKSMHKYSLDSRSL